MSNSHHSRFTWWHRDEIQVFIVFVILSWFFTRSDILEFRLFTVCGAVFAAPWFLRGMSRLRRSGTVPPVVGSAVDGIIRHLPPYPWDRSRLYYSFWSATIVAVLFAHRVELAVSIPE